jgi:hypothetical protein
MSERVSGLLDAIGAREREGLDRPAATSALRHLAEGLRKLEAGEGGRNHDDGGQPCACYRCLVAAVLLEATGILAQR